MAGSPQLPTKGATTDEHFLHGHLTALAAQEKNAHPLQGPEKIHQTRRFLLSSPFKAHNKYAIALRNKDLQERVLGSGGSLRPAAGSSRALEKRDKGLLRGPGKVGTVSDPASYSTHPHPRKLELGGFQPQISVCGSIFLFRED